MFSFISSVHSHVFQTVFTFQDNFIQPSDFKCLLCNKEKLKMMMIINMGMKELFANQFSNMSCNLFYHFSLTVFSFPILLCLNY